jgi:hypothetical protein
LGRRNLGRTRSRLKSLGHVCLTPSRPGTQPNPRGPTQHGLNLGPRKKSSSVTPGVGFTPAQPTGNPPPRPGIAPLSPSHGTNPRLLCHAQPKNYSGPVKFTSEVGPVGSVCVGVTGGHRLWAQLISDRGRYLLFTRVGKRRDVTCKNRISLFTEKGISPSLPLGSSLFLIAASSSHIAGRSHRRSTSCYSGIRDTYPRPWSSPVVPVFPTNSRR